MTPLHPEHARQRMGRVDRYGRSEKLDLFVDAEACIEFLGLGRRPCVLPDDGRQKRVARPIHEYMCVDLAGQGAVTDLPVQPLSGEVLQTSVDPLHPVEGALFGQSGTRPVRGMGLGEVGDAVSGRIKHRRLDGCRAQIDAEIKVSHGRAPP